MTKLFKRITAAAMAAVMTASAVVVANAADYANAADTTDTDFTVWVNGKDVKAKKATDEKDHYYKTDFAEVTGTYSGGKWTVMVTDSTVEDANAFLALFAEDKTSTEDAKVYSSKLNDTGKAMQKKAKAYATAKIKEGKITVTAGKTAGSFKVWLYEVKSKTVVNTTSIKPTAYTGTAYYAPTALVLTKENPITSNKVAKTAKAKLEDIEVGKEVTYYIADSKAELDISDKKPVYKVTSSTSKDAIAVDADTGSFTIKATEAGKVKITVTCEETGKKASFSVKAVEKQYVVTVVNTIYSDANATKEVKDGTIITDKSTEFYTAKNKKAVENTDYKLTEKK